MKEMGKPALGCAELWACEVPPSLFWTLYALVLVSPPVRQDLSP